MDRPIEKKSFMRRNVWYMAAAVAVVALLVWLVFTTSANTQTIDRNDVTISPVTRGKFDLIMCASTGRWCLSAWCRYPSRRVVSCAKR